MALASEFNVWAREALWLCAYWLLMILAYSVAVLFGHCLRQLEYDIGQATNGKEVIALLNERPFELMLLDLTMPKIDGVGFLSYLTNQSKTPTPSSSALIFNLKSNVWY